MYINLYIYLYIHILIITVHMRQFQSLDSQIFTVPNGTVRGWSGLQFYCQDLSFSSGVGEVFCQGHTIRFFYSTPKGLKCLIYLAKSREHISFYSNDQLVRWQTNWRKFWCERKKNIVCFIVYLGQSLGNIAIVCVCVYVCVQYICIKNHYWKLIMKATNCLACRYID
jgi:hypothetical protein